MMNDAIGIKMMNGNNLPLSSAIFFVQSIPPHNINHFCQSLPFIPPNRAYENYFSLDWIVRRPIYKGELNMLHVGSRFPGQNLGSNRRLYFSGGGLGLGGGSVNKWAANFGVAPLIFTTDICYCGASADSIAFVKMALAAKGHPQSFHQIARSSLHPPNSHPIRLNWTQSFHSFNLPPIQILFVHIHSTISMRFEIIFLVKNQSHKCKWTPSAGFILLSWKNKSFNFKAYYKNWNFPETNRKELRLKLSGKNLD